MSDRTPSRPQGAAVEPQSVRFREADASEQEDVLACFERIFGHPRDRAHWRWQYHESNPAGGVVSVAVADDRIVGAAGLMRQDLNHAGERIPAAQACDAMLDAEYRKSGRFTALALSNYELGASRGITFLFTFPNQNSFPTCIRFLGYRRAAVLRHFYRRLGVHGRAGRAADLIARPAWRASNRLALSVLARRTGTGLDVQSTDRLPDDLDGLLRSSRAGQVLSVWKDRDYLRWRYEQHPTHRYTFHVLREAGTPIGLAVVRVLDATAAICELITSGGRPRQAATLLRRLVAHYDGRGCDLIEFFGADPGFFDDAFGHAGFRAGAFSPLQMVVRSIEARHPLASDASMPHNWTVAYGDTDII